MPAVNAQERRSAIRKLVADTVRERVTALRNATVDHWNSIMSELFDVESIERNNAVVTATFNARDVLPVMMTDGSGYDWTNEFLGDKDLRIRTITHVTAGSSGWRGNVGTKNPLGLYMGEVSSIWETNDDVLYELPTPLLVLSAEDIPTDHPLSCSLMDPSEYNDAFLAFDVTDVVPVDCQTQREFKNRLSEIESDMESLTDALEVATKNCRTDVALINAVPELEKYINPTSVGSVSDLLKKAAG